MRDYTLFSRCEMSHEKISGNSWDVFVSAYNSSPRVSALWQAVNSSKRIWAVHREYGYASAEMPTGGDVVTSVGMSDEAEFVMSILDVVKSACKGDIAQSTIAFDITGFMRAELMFLVRALKDSGAANVDFFYSEPSRYSHKGWTQFSDGDVLDVRQVIGCEGLHDVEASNDLLVIGTGYDDALMASVAEHKPHSRKALVLGLPSLLPDMYQENVWRVSQAAESIGFGFSSAPSEHYAPANDPFVTATVVSELVCSAKSRDGVKNVYLSPLGTKAQVLGFAIYFATECAGSNGSTSAILPVVKGYARGTSEGVGRVWKYSVPFGALGTKW